MGAIKTINQQQIKRLYAIASNSGWTSQEVKEIIARFKQIKPEFASSTIISVDEYDKFCSFFGNSREEAEEIGYDFLWNLQGAVTMAEAIEPIASEPKIGTQIKLKSEQLNSQQKAVLENLLNWIQDESDLFYRLIGSAGTGKSYLVAKFLKEASEKDLIKFSDCIAIAPTHSAKKVLKNFLDKNDLFKIDTATIHSALGLTLSIESKGQELKKASADKEPICFYKFVILDEASMVGREIAEDLLKISVLHNLKLLIVGDDLQLPPVGEESAYLFEFNCPESRLTKIMRNSGKVSELQEAIKKRVAKNQLFNLQKDWFIKCNEEASDDNLIFLPFTEFRQEMFCAFERDPDSTKFLAFANKSVQEVNSKVRKCVFDLEVPFCEGEKLICNAPIQIKNRTIANNGDELKIVSVSPSFINLEGIAFEVFRLEAENLDQEGNLISFEVFDQSSKDFEIYKNRIEELYKDALTRKEKSAWRKYFWWVNAVANVAHTYALTIHKSQGRSIDTVFLEAPNCPQPKLQSRLWYVGVSRHTQRLYVCL